MLGRDPDGFPLPLGPDSLLGLVGTSRPSSSLPGGVQHQQCPGASCSLTVHCSQGWDGLVGLILPKSFRQLAGEQEPNAPLQASTPYRPLPWGGGSRLSSTVSGGRAVLVLRRELRAFLQRQCSAVLRCSGGCTQLLEQTGSSLV